MYSNYKEDLHVKCNLRLQSIVYRELPPHMREGRVELDEDGRPVHDIRQDCRFALIVTKVDKRTGRECGNVE